MREMFERIEELFGSASGDEKTTDTKADPDTKAYWRNDPRQKDVINRLVQNTHFLFDREIVSPIDKTQFKIDKGGRDIFRLVSVNSYLKRDDEILEDEPAWLDTDGGVLTSAFPAVPEKMHDHCVQRLTSALSLEDRAPDFISFCEFGFPPIDVSDIEETVKTDVFSDELEMEIDKRFVDRAVSIRDAAMEKSGATKVPFICYGSAHCALSRYNSAVVSPGGVLEDGWRLNTTRTDPLKDPKKESPETLVGAGPLVHKKRFPTRRAGERARVPADIGFRLYRHELGLISVIVCSDAVDINQFTNIVRLNDDADNQEGFQRIFLVLVPTYNFSGVLLDACRDLSLSARCNVLITNARGESDGKMDYRTRELHGPQLFFMGRNLRELKRTKNKVVISQNETEGVVIFDIDLHKQNEILDLTKNISRRRS